MLMKKIKHQSIQVKLLIYFFILIFIPFTTFNIAQFMITTDGITRSLIQSTHQMLVQLDSNITTSIDGIQKIAQVIGSDDDVEMFYNHSQKLSIETNCRNLLTNIKSQYPEISGILLLRNDDAYISNEMYKTSKDPLTEESWYIDASKNKNTKIISRPIARNLSTYTGYDSDEILSLIHPIIKNQEVIGTVVIDYSHDKIDELVNNTIVGIKGFTYIVNQYGDVMFTPVNQVTYRIDSKKLLQNTITNKAITIENKSYQIIVESLGINDWSIIGVFPIDELYSHANRFKFFQILMVLMISLLTIVFNLIIDKSITHPIKKLQQLMKKTETGNLDVNYDFDRLDEIGQLGMSFNQMINKIQNLLTLIEKEQKEKVDAELKVLQAQIKPHFLYNTLDTIRWMAVEHKAYDIESVIQSLTSLFRIGLNKGQDIISLSDELEHVNSYLMIQKYRYEDELIYEVINNCKNLYVLKLILQPLVENSIYHGIKEKDNIGKIVIEVHQSDHLIITVTDDGIGISEKKLQEINDALRHNQKNELGYGIFNINSRLKLTFGQNYGLTLKSSCSGVVVTIKHPIIYKENIHEIAHRR